VHEASAGWQQGSSLAAFAERKMTIGAAVSWWRKGARFLQRSYEVLRPLGGLCLDSGAGKPEGMWT
jgi:hypothetical protein